jgi:uncharacterized protein (TIGR03382 family)
MLSLLLIPSLYAQAPWGRRLLSPTLLANRERQAAAAQALGLSAAQEAALAEVTARTGLGLIEADALPGPLDHQRALEALIASEQVWLAEALGGRFPEFVAWADGAWLEEQAALARRREARLAPRSGGSLAFEVFATQYAANTTDEVAVPDYCIKFANLGWGTCTSGYAAPPYYVRLERAGYSREVWVGDVGPWNIDDNYWNTADDPSRPRRLFSDLPQGTPESEAAYYDDYNGGLDQYSRSVSNPAGIDLHPDVAADIGLAYLENDWVLVTFLWEPLPEEPEPEDTAPPEDTDPPGDSAPPAPDSAAPDTAAPDSGGSWRPPGGGAAPPSTPAGPPGEPVAMSALGGGCGCAGPGAPAGLGWLLLALVARRRR